MRTARGRPGRGGVARAARACVCWWPVCADGLVWLSQARFPRGGLRRTYRCGIRATSDVRQCHDRPEPARELKVKSSCIERKFGRVRTPSGGQTPLAGPLAGSLLHLHCHRASYPEFISRHMHMPLVWGCGPKIPTRLALAAVEHRGAAPSSL